MKNPTQTQIEEAIQWHFYFLEHHDSPESSIKFQSWLCEDPAHELAWTRIQHIYNCWNNVPKEAILKPATEMVNLQKNSNNFIADCHCWIERAKQKSSLWALVLLISGSLLGLNYSNEWALSADYRTRLGELKVIQLEDGSQLTLSSGSAVEVQYVAHERRIVLIKGQILVEVAKQANRPFVVQTNQGTVRALGTIFSVQQTNKKMTEVIVVESKVEACLNKLIRPVVSKSCETLVENQRVLLTESALGSVDMVDAKGHTAWTKGLINANEMPLSELLDTLSEYHTGFIKYDSKELSHYNISGVYAIDKPLDTLAAIQLILPIRVRTMTDGLVWVDINKD